MIECIGLMKNIFFLKKKRTTTTKQYLNVREKVLILEYKIFNGLVVVVEYLR